MSGDYTTLTGMLIKETDNAMLIKFDDLEGGNQAWIPRSLIPRLLKHADGRIEVDIPDWKVEDLGL